MEPTTTLVLTSHTRHFVDIRILKPATVASAFDAPDAESLPPERLDWAFAGKSEIAPLPSRKGSMAPSSSVDSSSSNSIGGNSGSHNGGNNGGNDAGNNSGNNSGGVGEAGNGTGTSASGGSTKSYTHPTGPHHSVWTHWVDSRSDNPPRDEGDCYPQGTAIDDNTLEKGRMVNPRTGLEQDYEELWRELVPRRLPGEGGMISVVLCAENKDLGTRGVIVRVGGWCQGILKVGGEVGVERWRFGGGGVGFVGDGLESEGKAKGWERLVKIGGKSLPCQVCWDRQDLKEGGEIVSGGLKWTVVEKHLWN